MTTTTTWWSHNRQQLCTFPEAERYERLVRLEGQTVFVQYGRKAELFRQITGKLLGITYPLDTTKEDPPSNCVIEDEHGCWVTVKSSSIRSIEPVT